METIRYIDNLPGAGKTYNIARMLSKHVRSKETAIYVAPTLLLLSQMSNSVVSFLGSDFDQDSIRLVQHLDGLPVTRQITMLVTETATPNYHGFTYKLPGEGLIILCTHEAFLRTFAREDINKGKLHLYFDEVFKPAYSQMQLTVSESLAKTLKVAPDKGYLPLEVEVTSKVLNAFKSERNRFLHNLDRMQSRYAHYSTKYYISHETKPKRRLSVVGVHNMELLFGGWSSVTVAAAAFTQTQMYHTMFRSFKMVRNNLLDTSPRIKPLMRRLSCADIIYLHEDEGITSKGVLDQGIMLRRRLKPTEISDVYQLMDSRRADVGRPLSLKKLVQYASDPNSKYTISDTEQNVLDILKGVGLSRYTPLQYYVKIAEKVTRYYYLDQKMLLFINVGRKTNSECPGEYYEELMPIEADWIPVPFISHGLNMWQHANVATYLATVNPKPIMCDFYSEHLPEYDYNLEYTVHHALQCIMRSSVRNINATDKPVVIVPTKRMAQQLWALLLEKPNVVSAASIMKLPRFKPVVIRRARTVQAQDYYKNMDEYLRSDPAYAEYSRLKAKAYRQRGKPKYDELVKARDKVLNDNREWFAQLRAKYRDFTL